MKLIFACLFIVCLFPGCRNHEIKSKDFFNSDRYNISVGDTLRIYYTTNSCCYYCLPGKHESSLLEYIGEELVVPSEKDCDGCSSTSALLFVANSPGTVELKGRIVAASRGCEDSTATWETFFVHISENGK
jgi:hypothetical protein